MIKIVSKKKRFKISGNSKNKYICCFDIKSMYWIGANLLLVTSFGSRLFLKSDNYKRIKNQFYSIKIAKKKLSTPYTNKNVCKCMCGAIKNITIFTIW